MPYADPNERRQVHASSMRNSRIYLSAVRAGDPKALLAEHAKNPMGPLNALDARLMALPQPERNQHRAEYARVKAECEALADQDCDALYRRLRAEVIAEVRGRAAGAH